MAAPVSPEEYFRLVETRGPGGGRRVVKIIRVNFPLGSSEGVMMVGGWGSPLTLSCLRC